MSWNQVELLLILTGLHKNQVAPSNLLDLHGLPFPYLCGGDDAVLLTPERIMELDKIANRTI